MPDSTVFGSQHAEEFGALLAIAETGSFARAGQKLQRHPSVLSKRITALETRLGVRLMERSTRSLQLTEAGLVFLEKIQLAAQVLQEAEQQVGQLSRSAAGVLRLSVPAGMGRLWLSPLIAGFAKAHPAITVHVDYGDQYVDVIAEGYDACIRVGTLQDSQLVATRLCSHSRMLCASPAYLAQHGTPQQPQDLTTHRCLGHLGLRSYPEWHLSRGRQQQIVMARGSFMSNDGESLLEAARQGLGILGASNWLVATDMQQGRLVPVLPGWTFDTTSAVYLVRPSIKFTPHKVIAFKHWMENAFMHGPPWTTSASKA